MKRRGLSLTEVLIAMGILTLGLLGVASVFPVASFYMQKAETTDIASQLGQSAMNDLVTRGMLDPRSWFVMTPSPSSTTTGDPNYVFANIDSKYAPFAVGPVAQPLAYTRPFAEVLAKAITVLNSADDVTHIPFFQADKIPAMLTKQVGSAYCIDPIGGTGHLLCGKLFYRSPKASHSPRGFGQRELSAGTRR